MGWNMSLLAHYKKFMIFSKLAVVHLNSILKVLVLLNMHRSRLATYTLAWQLSKWAWY